MMSLFLGYMMIKMRHDIDILRKDMDAGFKEVRAEMTAGFKDVRAEINELALKTEHRFEKIEARIENRDKYQDQSLKPKTT